LADEHSCPAPTADTTLNTMAMGEPKNGILPYKGGTYYLWHYIPSMPGAIIFIILFILATAGHSYRMIRFRQWFYIPFIIGCICELGNPSTIT
jgi:hypothetical protein